MILHKQLLIGGNVVEFDDYAISLNLLTPGTATFNVLGSAELRGVVVFSVGFNKSSLINYFVGYIDQEPTRASKDYSIIYCRELTALLRADVPLALRICSINDVLGAISKQLSLSFNTPSSAGYSALTAPYFYSVGNGYHCMDSLSDVYDIDKLLWQQQVDGSVYVGSWSDSFYATRPVQLPDNMFSKHKLGNKAVLPPSPKLRPGVFINGRGIVDSAVLKDDEITITWSEDPWKEK